MYKTKAGIIEAFPMAGGKGYNAETERAMNVIGSRIAKARGERGMSLAAFAGELENYGVYVSAAAINKWEKGGSAPNAYQLLAISRALDTEDGLSYFMSSYEPELNEAGLRKLADYKADLVASGRYRTKRAAVIEYIDMPVSSLAVSAGTGAFLDEGNFELLSFPASTVPKGADFGVRISGDSMEPVYHDGQIVWVQSCERVNVGEVGVFVYDGEGYIKLYDEKEPSEDCMELFADSYGDVRAQSVLISYNKAYEPREVSPYRDFRVVGRVL